MLKKELVGKLLTVFGTATLFASIVDASVVLLPLHLSNSQWVYGTVGKISDAGIVPLIGIIAIVCGFYLSTEKENKFLLFAERTMAGICSLFALYLIIFTFLFSVSLNSVENTMNSKIKGKGKEIKEQINMIADKNSQIPREEVQKKIEEIDKSVLFQVKQSEKYFIKTNIKILANLLLYIFVYVYFALSLFKTAMFTRKKYIYKNK